MGDTANKSECIYKGYVNEGPVHIFWKECGCKADIGGNNSQR